MALRHDGLLVFPGINGIEGLCHVRVYELRREPPVVIVGALEDNPGALPGVVIELVAAAVHQQVIRRHRPFRLIFYHPSGGPPFVLVEFDQRTQRGWRDRQATYKRSQIITIDEDSLTQSVMAPLENSPSRRPRWSVVEDIDTLVGEHAQTCPKGEYTAVNLFGEEGQRILDEVTTRVRKAGAEFRAQIQE